MGVLVVEDDRELRAAVVEALRDGGFNVSEAGNGLEALGYLTDRGNETPCLILLDLMMPGMDGWSFLQTIRAYNRLSRIPVIISTGVGPTAHIPPAVSVLRKPYDLDTLLDVARQHC